MRASITEPDHWVLKPALASLAAIGIIQLICGLPGTVSFFLIPLSLLCYGITVLAALVMALYCFLKQRPKRGASILLVFLLPILLWRPLNWFVDVVHVGLTQGFGAGQLGVSASYEDGAFTAHDWSVGLAGANTFLIHDTTGEIALPLEQHKLHLSHEQGFEAECAGKVGRLIGRYYICNF